MTAAVKVFDTLATANAVSGVTGSPGATSASPAVPCQLVPSGKMIAAESPGCRLASERLESGIERGPDLGESRSPREAAGCRSALDRRAGHGGRRGGWRRIAAADALEAGTDGVAAADAGLGAWLAAAIDPASREHCPGRPGLRRGPARA